MTDEFSKDVVLGDPLHDVTRKERRMLLGVSVLAIALVKTGLVPTKISALGVEFNETHPEALLLVVGLINVYFLFAFSIYALSDFLAWRKMLEKYFKLELKRNYDQQIEDARREEAEMLAPPMPGYDPVEELQQEQWQALRKQKKGDAMVHKLTGPTSIVRAFFEFALPLLVGFYSLFLLWMY